MAAEAPLAALQRRAVRLRPEGGLLVFLVLAVPSVWFYLRLSDSYAAGTAIVALGLLAHRWPRRTTDPLSLRHARDATVAACLVVGIHLMLAAAVGPIALGRALPSMLLLALCSLASVALADILARIDDRQLHRQLLGAGALMLAVSLVALTGWGPPVLSGEPWRRPFFPFAEPAGFALALAPVYLYACVSLRGWRRAAVLLAGLLGVALLQTLTLTAGFALAAIVCLKRTQLLVFGLLVVAIATQMDLSYYLERLDFGEETSNLSNLVFVQGWQMVPESLQRSGGIGLGFQQLGMHGTEVDAALLLRVLRDGDDLNVLDGGLLFAKLGGEFGVFGIALAALLLLRCLRSMWILGRVAARRRRVRSVEVLGHAVATTFLIHLFLRSGGYFTGDVMLFVAALWILHSERQARAAVPASGTAA